MDQKFNDARPILEKLESNGYEAYFVGGSVRDYLLQKNINDVDIATSATPIEVMNLFQSCVPVGLEHGTIIVIENGINYEITTFRTETEYEDFRRPSEVTFVRNLEEDLKRRDFTINAMAMSGQGEIIDLYRGRNDLRDKLIRTVGNPDERFSEDALRMLRGIRFISQLGFYLEEDTSSSIRKNAVLLSKISIERITSEFEKILIGEYFKESIALIDNSNLVTFLPEMNNYKENFIYCNNYQFSELKKIEERWALLLLVLNVDDTWNFLKSWKLPRRKILNIQFIIDGVKESQRWSSYLVYKKGLENSISIELVSSIFSKREENINLITKLYSELPIHHNSEININGNDLIDWKNRKAGKWIAEYMASIEMGIIDGSILNTKEDIKEAILLWEK